MTNLILLLCGLIIYFVMEFKANAIPTFSLGYWLKDNIPSILIYIAGGVAYYLIGDMTVTKMEAFMLGLAPNLVIDWVQTLVTKKTIKAT